MLLRNTLAVLAATALMAGCTSKSDSDTDTTAQGTDATAAWMLASMPADVKGVTELKKSAAEGDTVSVRGKIGGRLDALGKSAAIFVMMDSAIPSCADAADDHCPTPWDYCCETPESKTANSATIQLVDETGVPRTISLEEHGFNMLDEVVVVGEVQARPSDAVLVIKAEKIYRIAG